MYVYNIVQVPIIDIPGIGNLSAVTACEQFKVYTYSMYVHVSILYYVCFVYTTYMYHVR